MSTMLKFILIPKKKGSYALKTVIL